MRIVIWTPNYAPELIGIAPLATDLAEWLVQRGHRVDVVTPMPHYPSRRVFEGYKGRWRITETRAGVEVHRRWLRVKPEERPGDKALYEISVASAGGFAVAGLARNADVLICVVPTVLAAYVATRLPRRPRTVLWVQDIVSMGAGAMSLGPVGMHCVRAAAWLEKAALRRAESVVLCSPGFYDQFLERGIAPERMKVIYNWARVRPCVGPAPVRESDRLRVLYAGNLGYSQGFETLFEAAQIAGSAVRVTIVGDGNAAQTVRRMAKGAENVRVEAPASEEAFRRLLHSHDAHLVLQRRVSAGANLPSKIATYLASGRPVVASIVRATPAAELLAQSRGAILVEPESGQALASAFLKLLRSPAFAESLGKEGRAFADQELSSHAALSRFERIVLGG